MANSVNEILADARSLCREPTHEQLPLSFMVRAFNRIQTLLTNSLSLSRQNHLLVKKFLGTTSRDFLVQELSAGSLVTVELRLSERDDSWADVPIVNRTAINSSMNEGRRVAAQYGNRVRLSWSPQDSNDAIQIWYEPVPAASTISDSPQIRSAYHPLLVYMLAKECWEGWMGNESREDINNGIGMFMGQWEKAINKTPEQRPGLRGVAYGLGRYGGRRWQ